MIPNSLSWWIVNVSDRTIISIVLGTMFNGIYTVSCKFSNILNSIFSIFNMSWQESASLHINDKDRDNFFSNIINYLFNLFFCLSLIIIAIIPLFYDLLIGNEYLNSYVYIPILMLGNLFQILIQLFGGIYIAKKLTKQIMNTTILSAIFNFILNILFIKKIGLYAACLSTVLSYAILCIYRYIDVQKYVNVKISKKAIVIDVFLFSICSLLYYYNCFSLNILNLCLMLLYTAISNKKFIHESIRILVKKFHSILKK